MRKIIPAAFAACFALPAIAADMAVKAPPYVSPYTWNGVWIGVRGGYGVNSTGVGTLSDGVSAVDIGAAPKGFVGGANAGLDFQLSSAFVGGLYIEQDFADLRSTANMGGSVSLVNLTNYLGAAGARFGYLVTPTSLLYVKGGFAWVGAHPDFSAVGTSKSISDTSTGYELGVGLEHRITPNWSIKIEYDHTHAGDKAVDIGGGLTSTAHFTVDKGMAGVSYRF